MNQKLKIKIIIDVCMFLALMLLMPYGMVGETAHEWIGMAIFILFLFHHIMNRKWTANIGKGKYSPIRLVQTVLAVALLFLMLGSMVSGILLSRYIFKEITIVGTANMARNIHMISAYWGFVLMSVHLGIHWNIFVQMIRKKTGTWSKKVQWLLRVIAVAIAIYGISAFIKRNIGKYMFLKWHFVMFDYTEPLYFFWLDYLAVMGTFVFAGYYFSKILRQWNKKTLKRRFKEIKL